MVLLGENRNIRTFWDVDIYWVAVAGNQIIAFQGSPQFIGLYTDNGIDCLVKIITSPEYTGCHSESFNFITVPGKCLQYYKFQEFSLTFRCGELRTNEYSLKLITDRISRDIFRRKIWGRCFFLRHKNEIDWLLVFVEKFYC